MNVLSSTRTAVCAAALLVSAGTLVVHAQDPATPAPVQTVPPADAAATAPAAAEPARSPEEVVARVGAATVTEGDLAVAREALGAQLGQVPEAEQRGRLIDFMVDMEIRAQAARDAGLDKGPEYEARVDFLKVRALQDIFIEKNVTSEVSPADLQKAFETLVLAQFKPEEQIRARHILVEKKEEAEKIIADLKGGAAFEELAKQSKDPSGQNGGDLGYFGRGQMVPPFEEAAFALEPGAVTQTPVESQFGWHVIKLEDKRMSQPPALADVQDELRNYVLQQKFEAVMADLRAKYPAEIVGGPKAGNGPPSPAGEAAPAAGKIPEPGVTPQN